MNIDIPDELYQRLQQHHQRPQLIEQWIIQQLNSLMDGPFGQLEDSQQAELLALASLSDDALWTIAAEQLPLDLQLQMQALLANQVALNKEQQIQLQDLLQRADSVMLRKSEAMTLLSIRGYSVTIEDLTHNA